MSQELARVSGVTRRIKTDPETGEQYVYYVGTLRTDIAKAVAFVPVIDDKTLAETYLNHVTEHGYQRPGSKTRMRRFAEYLENMPLSFVPAVILSGRGGWNFEGDGAFGDLVVGAPAAVVDGQHRLGGFVCQFEKDEIVRQVDFFLLADLTLEQEKEAFTTINGSAKGVSKDLIEVLKDSDEGTIAQSLDNQEDSPFHGKIGQAKKAKGDLFAFKSMVEQVRTTFKHGAFDETILDVKMDIMIRYWDIIADAFPEEWLDIDRVPREQEFKMLELTGLIAWSLAAADILGPAFDAATQTMNWDMVRAKVSHLALAGSLDWRKDGEFQNATGAVGGPKIHKKIQNLLQQSVGDSEEDDDF